MKKVCLLAAAALVCSALSAQTLKFGHVNFSELVQLMPEMDEARTKSFYESGKWSAADREAMYRRAYSLMKRNCLTPKNIRAAQNNAEAQMQNIMKSLGFRAVTVKFDNNKHTQTQ